MKKFLFCLISTLFGFKNPTFAQLQPGFSPQEYRDFLGITAGSVNDENFGRGIPQNPNLKKIYESPQVGLENKWYLWIEEDKKIGWLTIRGTVNNNDSWLANFYAAMIPAQGSIQINNSYQFQFDLSPDPKAAVHVGWTLATGALAESMVPKIDSLYQNGYRDFIISGHSQGGAISYLMTSHILSLREKGRWEEPVRIKTYASAAPKPGNLYYSYSFEFQTRGAWAFNVVNGADWVPETPFSIQTTQDFNPSNPFVGIDEIIKKQKFPQNLAFRKVYNKLDKPSKKSFRNFQKYLGNFAEKQVKKSLPEFQAPEYYNSNNYSRTGNFIILFPNKEYWEKYPEEKGKIFKHHALQPYLFLLEKQYLSGTLD
ncbi:lipase family protein [Algoriphagus mannitolivorans]|uniref:lipase family protein n=1 Tax=Algoriphagus mannitolivorans TaxID=226504 RepID=UPI0004027FD1|nr:lipase family protein [Algoriphagus mannitolivorans]